MQDKPSATELLEALASFLGEELAPKLEGGLRFKVLVAANVAGIVARELALGPDQDRAQLARLVALLGDLPGQPKGGTPMEREGGTPGEEERGTPVELEGATPGDDTAARVRVLSEELCRRIDAGDADEGPFRAAVLAHLKACVDEKLAVDNPARVA